MSETKTNRTTRRPLRLTDANFRAEVLENDQPVLVDFWADRCGPCHVLAPTIEKLASQYQASVKVGKLEIDESPETAAAYGVRSIPSVLIFKNGEVVDAIVGVQPKHHYEQVLEQVAVAGKTRGGAQ